jgi:hypothetical protein
MLFAALLESQLLIELKAAQRGSLLAPFARNWRFREGLSCNPLRLLLPYQISMWRLHFVQVSRCKTSPVGSDWREVIPGSSYVLYALELEGTRYRSNKIDLSNAFTIPVVDFMTKHVSNDFYHASIFDVLLNGVVDYHPSL